MSIDRHTRYPYTTDTNLWFLNLVDIDDRSAVAVTAVFLRGSARRARLVSFRSSHSRRYRSPSVNDFFVYVQQKIAAVASAS
jgi:hypothetical protein